MPILDHFSLVAPFYERVIRLSEISNFVRRAALPTNGWLLDAGGGTGRVSAALCKNVDHVVIADASFGMLLEAKSKTGLNPTMAVSEGLPFADNSFERIIMVDALHHMADQTLTTRELWRVLKPGGRIVIEEPDVRTLIIKFVAIAEKLALMRSHFLSPPQIEVLFAHDGAQTQIETESYNAWVLIDKPQ